MSVVGESVNSNEVELIGIFGVLSRGSKTMLNDIKLKQMRGRCDREDRGGIVFHPPFAELRPNPTQFSDVLYATAFIGVGLDQETLEMTGFWNLLRYPFLFVTHNRIVENVPAYLLHEEVYYLNSQAMQLQVNPKMSLMVTAPLYNTHAFFYNAAMLPHLPVCVPLLVAMALIVSSDNSARLWPTEEGISSVIHSTSS
jgi:hypothetical protein